MTRGAAAGGAVTRPRARPGCLTRYGGGTFPLMQDGDWEHLAFPGDGEMVRRMRDYPWAGSALGDPRDWPSSLRTACRICLTSRFPMIVWWGPELRFVYNDAYMPLLGDKHPALGLPGRQVWSEIWDTIGPMLQSVMSTGRATWSEDLLLPMRRHAYWEETYWTYSYSPLHDEDGTVRGVFTAVTESTEQVVGRRRLAVLQDLGSQAGRGRGVAEVCDLVVRTLARAGQVVPYAAVYLRGPEGDGDVTGGSAVLAASSAAGPPPAWPADEVLRSGQPVTVTDVAERFGPLPSGGWPEPPAEAMVLPLQSDGGRTIGVIVLAASSGRALDAAYLNFLDLVARQTAALVNGAIAYQAQQRRAEELAELDRAKTTFFSNVSHEFRTPLTLIMGPLEELRRRLGPADAATAADLDVIHRNGLRLGKLVNTLLDFSRIEAGRMQARYEPVDLAAFTAELASVFRSAIERAGLRCEVDCPPLTRAGLRRPRRCGRRSSSTCSATPSSSPSPATSPSAVRRRGRPGGVCASPTPASGSPPRSCRGCSSVSTASRTRGRAPTRAPASASRWCASWSGCTAARITVDSAESARAPPSRSACRSASEHLPADAVGDGARGRRRRLARSADPYVAGGAALAARRRRTAARPAPIRRPGAVGRGRRRARRGSSSPTTTPTCASTCTAAAARLPGRARSTTGRPRSTPSGAVRPTWSSAT